MRSFDSSPSLRLIPTVRFWNNKGAVAGVFTVVGLIALALLIVLVTTTIRRRRARQYDRELAEAAAPGPGPVYLDDDDDFPARNRW